MPHVRVLGVDVHYVEHGAAAGEAERTAVSRPRITSVSRLVGSI